MKEKNAASKLEALRSKLEGPKYLRAAAGAAALAVICTTVYSSLDFAHELTQFSQLYMKGLCVASCVGMLAVEFKDSKNTAMSEWFHKWFPFLTVSWGKGMFMIMSALLGLSFIEEDFDYIFLPNCVLLIVGVIYTITWLAQHKKNTKRFKEKTVLQTSLHLSAIPESEPLLAKSMAYNPKTRVVGAQSSESF